MISLGVLLKHYKRRDIQEEMIKHAKDREVATRFHDKFGKRPDVLKYPNDIIELAKQGATSFHCSEELWSNPLRLDPRLKRKEMDELRTGWDLVLDIDCPYWEYSKLITHLMIKALKKHGVKSVSCKFSGNKGFHIGVPFEAFPQNMFGVDETRLWFPDGVKTIAMYLTDYIDSAETDFELTKGILRDRGINDVAKELDIPYESLVKTVCDKCETEVTKKKSAEKQNCIYCNEINDIQDDKNFFQCKKCMKLVKLEGSGGVKCPKCKNSNYKEKFDISKILNVDTLLISSRHLYRMPYSLHEKSGLCSVPIDPDKVMEFDKKEANTDEVTVSKFVFLEKETVGETNAGNLFDQAGYWSKRMIEKEGLQEKYSGGVKKEFEALTIALAEDFFPPCMTAVLKGIPDGKKRAIFMLINFLSNVGWGYDEIEKKLKEWNEINEEPLKEVYILGQLRHYKGRKDKILPPNCDNKSYYEDMRVCNPDNLCNKVKNPVNYSLRKARFMKLNKKDDKGDKKEGSNDDKKANGKADGKVESKTEEGKGAITK
ncbi:MAG: hypothetical protein QF824_06250 [Candidatus Woesearchaeota archaeon]|jgi:hypothetical protein|nr:hypothetical protein [Candidatus Woesearchaeota archaeon]